MTQDMVGGKQVRAYRFLDDNRLELSVVAANGQAANGAVLLWQLAFRRRLVHAC